MNTHKLIAGIVAAAIAIIMLAAVLMPVLNDATTTHETFKNEGYYDVIYTETDSIDLLWDYTAPRQVTINDEVIELPDIVNSTPRTILCGDDWVLRFIKLNSGYYGVNLVTSSKIIGASESATSSLTLEATGGTMTASATGGYNATASYTYMYCISNDGSMTMKDSTKPAYVNGDSTIYATGGTANVWPLVDVFLKIDGTIDDGFTYEVIYYSGDDPITITDVSVNYAAVSGFDDLYTVSDFTVTVSNGVDTKQLTYSYYIVPLEVTAERSVHLTDAMNVILNVIPLLIIVSVLLGVVAIFILRRE